MHERNCFITLTYSDENLPYTGSVDVKHWQDFAKRMRKKLGPFRFLHCGEYGDETQRPHYHACIFGQDFAEDRVVLSEKEGHTLWTSATLEQLWGKGFCPIGPLTFDTAAYTARYALKKIGGALQTAHYERVREDTGEVFTVAREYATMSRRPGLGQTWFAKFIGDVYPGDFVVIKGQKFRPPKYYDLLLGKLDDKALEVLKNRRRVVAEQKKEEESFERREVRRRVVEAKIKIKRRVL